MVSDHFKYANEYKRAGIPTYYPFEMEESEVMHKVVRFGGFQIQAFPLVHDVPCYGFYIQHKECGKCLFITDTKYVPQYFGNLKANHIFIECDYMDGMINKDAPNYERKIKWHCSLKTCIGCIEMSRTNALRTVILLHMGKESCEPIEAVAAVRKVAGAGVNVDYAEKGKEWELSEIPF